MVNILIFLILLGVFKLFVLVGYGYYTFRRVDRPDCYGNSDSGQPSPSRVDDSYENVTMEYLLILEIGFWITLFQFLLFLPSIQSQLVQKILCLLFIPDFALFIFLNCVILRNPAKACQGDHLADEERVKLNYLPQEEGDFLFVSLICQWVLVAYLILVIGCVHTCFTFCFRV